MKSRRASPAQSEVASSTQVWGRESSELLRKGRFDEMWFVNLPTKKEREEIFRIHLEKVGRESLIGTKIDVEQLAEETPGFSGAEVEAVVREALYDAFEVDKELNMFDLQEAVGNVIPLRKLMGRTIDDLEKWADGRCRFANMPEEVVGQAPGTRAVQM